MSTRKGDTKSRAPKHQNKFAYKHNKNSKKTQKILSLPNMGLCKRCHDIIEWRKAFRKYKPLTTPKKCGFCEQKTIKAAYHTACDPCAREKNVCAKCLEAKEIFVDETQARREEEKDMELIEQDLKGLPERKRRTILRKLERGEINSDSESDEEGDDDDDDDGDDDGEEEDQDDIDDEEAKPVRKLVSDKNTRASAATHIPTNAIREQAPGKIVIGGNRNASSSTTPQTSVASVSAQLARSSLKDTTNGDDADQQQRGRSSQRGTAERRAASQSDDNESSNDEEEEDDADEGNEPANQNNGNDDDNESEKDEEAEERNVAEVEDLEVAEAAAKPKSERYSSWLQGLNNLSGSKQQ